MPENKYEEQLRAAERSQEECAKALRAAVQTLLGMGCSATQIQDSILISIPETVDQERARRIVLDALRGAYPNPPKERIEELVSVHERLYTRRLVSGNPAINIDETSRLRDIWRSIGHKMSHGQDLDQVEKDEITDALESM